MRADIRKVIENIVSVFAGAVLTWGMLAGVPVYAQYDLLESYRQGRVVKDKNYDDSRYAQQSRIIRTRPTWNYAPTKTARLDDEYTVDGGRVCVYKTGNWNYEYYHTTIARWSRCRRTVQVQQ